MKPLLILLLLASPAFAQRTLVPHTDRYAAVVPVECEIVGGARCSGSGMLLDSMHAITASHCVRSKTLIVFLPEPVPADVIALHVRNDWALLRFREPVEAVSVKVRKTELDQGEVVFGYGFGRSQGRFGITKGRYEGTNVIGGPVEEGDSGGPVLDASGELVGVCTEYTYGTDSWRGHALGSQAFRDFLSLREIDKGVEVVD